MSSGWSSPSESSHHVLTLQIRSDEAQAVDDGSLVAQVERGCDDRGVVEGAGQLLISWSIPTVSSMTTKCSSASCSAGAPRTTSRIRSQDRERDDVGIAGAHDPDPIPRHHVAPQHTHKG